MKYKQSDKYKDIFNDCKICKDCREEKPLLEFSTVKNSTKNGTKLSKSSYCKTCTAYRTRFYKYGLTRREIENLRVRGCYICGSYTKLCVDHCHSGGELRGILCGACNSGLGFFKDNIDNLVGAIVYLQRAEELKEIGDFSEFDF